MAELVPIVAAVLIVFAAIDIYRNDPRKSKRKNEDTYNYNETTD